MEKFAEIREILAKNLKNQRKKSGYTQEKFAEVSGLSIQTINDIEGRRKWVSDKTLSKLSQALNIECYQLLIPDYKVSKKEAVPAQKLMSLMKELKKDVSSRIDDHFTEFLKIGGK